MSWNTCSYTIQATGNDIIASTFEATLLKWMDICYIVNLFFSGLHIDFNSQILSKSELLNVIVSSLRAPTRDYSSIAIFSLYVKKFNSLFQRVSFERQIKVYLM